MPARPLHRAAGPRAGRNEARSMLHAVRSVREPADRVAERGRSSAENVSEVGHRRHATQMSVEVLRWENLLAGEELAYLGDRAGARRALRTAAGRARRVRPRRRPALCAPARGVGRSAARRARDRHDRHCVRKDARVQPARARCDRARREDARALPLPDEGARAGSVPHARRVPRAEAAAGDLRRRHADRAAAADPARRRTSSSATPTCSTSASFRTTTAGATCSQTSATSSSTRRTCIAASSARMSRTCCAA